MRILQDEKLTPQQLEEFDALAKASESPVVRTLMQNIAEVLRNGGNLLSAEEDAALSPNEAAKQFGMSRTFLNRLLDQGKIPYYKVGTHRRIRLVDLVLFEQQRDSDRIELAQRLARQQQTTRAVDATIADLL
ncbi:hypothetical protein HMPREF3153_04630 [Corynebacterium sp. HMSC06C06]|uniref:helix-turn-helix domain-containing protein n=1 Tax=Corynebacterium TaxID=1716 RepID=UPI0008A1E587|nr:MULTISPECIES: helix-turn-helix domain-containing protein [Corynebacterium]MDK7884992.1 helix-turn-helix domain-containing protein [Corynebacterium striatum]MDK8812018.1 helix-turn-helix domain-containing protein [Corynebacterium striatum]OFT52751.1 hypothetical protein HMPREF3153_04630 [Corynebacterium sp. HMSC06C06]HAT1548389.1 helix-turn-helix domain-containing protein [Corynebacterium striatum]HCG3140687.1 helix-turn-helix domain-containing protein [Corynebacterium striatum]